MEPPQNRTHVNRPVGTTPRLYFGDFDLDAETGELRRGGRIVPLRPLASRALLLLVGRAGRLTTRDQLRETLWVDSFLDWNQALNQCIRQIRNALGDSADKPVYLETVHHRGYRFLTPVTTGLRTPAVPVAGLRRGGYRLFLAGMGATLAIVAILFSICIRL